MNKDLDVARNFELTLVTLDIIDPKDKSVWIGLYWKYKGWKCAVYDEE